MRAGSQRGQAARRPGAWARVGATCLAWALLTAVSFGQSGSYKPKSGILNWKAVLLGGAFRVTTAIPLRGDFSKYERLEIVQAESLIGSDVPARTLDQLTRGLASEFHKGKRFSSITIADTFGAPAPRPQLAGTLTADSFRDADPLDAPMRAWEDLLVFDRQRQAAAKAAESDANATLVVRCQVIDYAKGNKLLQLLFIDLGNAVLTLRFSYYDKDSGEELGRSVISSDNRALVIPSVLSRRTALPGVVEGLVDQITRRQLAGER